MSLHVWMSVCVVPLGTYVYMCRSICTHMLNAMCARCVYVHAQCVCACMHRCVCVSIHAPGSFLTIFQFDHHVVLSGLMERFKSDSEVKQSQFASFHFTAANTSHHKWTCSVTHFFKNSFVRNPPVFVSVVCCSLLENTVATLAFVCMEYRLWCTDWLKGLESLVWRVFSSLKTSIHSVV